MEDLRKLEVFLQSHVSDKDLQYVARQLARLKKRAQDGGTRNRGRQYRRHMRGGTRKQQIFRTVLIIIVCLSILGVFNDQCRMASHTKPHSVFVNASTTDWLFYCDQWIQLTNHPYDYIWKFQSIYGPLMNNAQVRSILDFAKQQIVTLALGGTGVTGVGVYARMLKNQQKQTNKTRTASQKYRLLEDKILSPIRPPRKKWMTFQKIANPDTGRLLLISAKKGKYILQCYLQQQTQKCKKLPNICDPQTGVWMDVNTEDGRTILQKYKEVLRTNIRPE